MNGERYPTADRIVLQLKEKREVVSQLKTKRDSKRRFRVRFGRVTGGVHYIVSNVVHGLARWARFAQ